jgi:S-adenosylmethionine-diacylglycerol 3-amino-3-carboxypropyl transferase
LLSLVFFRKYKFEKAAPIYLRREYFSQLKEALTQTRIRIITGLLEEVLKNAPDHSFDAFSFSDIGSYMTDEVFNRHLDQVVRTARPGARFCARLFLLNRTLASDAGRSLIRNPEMERDLALHDHAMIHQFIVGEIR